MYIFGQVHVLVCVYVHVGAKGQHQLSSSIISHLVFWGRGNSPYRLGCLASISNLPISPVPLGMFHRGQFIQWVLEIEFRSSHLKASVSPTEPSPQLLVLPLKGSVTSQCLHTNSLQMTLCWAWEGSLATQPYTIVAFHYSFLLCLFLFQNWKCCLQTGEEMPSVVFPTIHVIEPQQV